MFRKILLIAVSSIVATCAMGQLKSYDEQVNRIVPPSPNVASLGKYGETPVNMYTGIPEISVPIYNISGRDINVPISLSYHAGGVKVEEIASWVGLGWSLNAGGVITRQQRGGPDDGGGTVSGRGVLGYMDNLKKVSYYDSLLTFTSPEQNRELEEYLRSIASGDIDAEPDIFYYNFCGVSGKFVYSQDKQQFINIPDKAFKIQFDRSNSTWTIITDKGLKCYFTDQEVTTSKPYCNELINSPSTSISGWYLSKIVNADQTDSVSFYYQGGAISYYGIGGSYRKNYTAQYSSGGSSTNVGLIPQTFQNDCYISIDINQRILSRIETATNKIVFVRDTAMRLDMINDYALKKILVYNVQNELVNSFRFDYDYFTSSNVLGGASFGSTYGKRLKLTQVHEMGSDTVASVLNNWKNYAFTYNEQQTLPYRLSYAQDYWGYFNGKGNLETFVPKLTKTFSNNYDVPVVLPGADKSVDTSFNQAGILKTIVYPTGGRTSFIYETNTVPYQSLSELDLPTHWENVKLSDFKNSYLDLNDTYIRTFTINQEPSKVNNYLGGVFVNTTINPECGPELSSTCAGFNISGPKNIAFPQSSQNLYLPNGTYTMTVDLRPLKAQVSGGQIFDAGNFLFSIDYRAVDSNLINIPVGGLRVKSVISEDSEGHIAFKKNYKYVLDSSGKSSGWTNSIPSFLSTEYADMVIYAPYPTITDYLIAGYVVRNSSSVYPLVGTQGSVTGYTRVEESSSDQNENGRNVHLFTGSSSNLMDAKQFPFPPMFNPDWQEGMEKAVYTQKKLTNDYAPVLTKSNFYNYLLRSSFVGDSSFLPIKGVKSSYNYYSYSYFLPQREIEIRNLGQPLPIWNMYAVATGRAWLAADTTITYSQVDGGAITEVKDMEYDGDNFQVKKIKTLSSKNELKEQFIKYPKDLGYHSSLSAQNKTALSAMLGRNEVSTPVMDSSVINGKPVSQNIAAYVVKGKQVVMQKQMNAIASEPFRDVLLVNTYDDQGNILNYKKYTESDVSVIWDYGRTMAIAKVINANTDSVAYTSFEADGTGNWTVNLSGRVSSNAFTGKYAYQLANGTISKNGLNAGKNYVVSYWTLNSAPFTIAGTQGPVLKTPSATGWTYYEHIVTGQTSVNISGSGLIDEVRLYPKGAQMTSFTYKHLVGTTSQADVNGRTVFYEYDTLGRLRLVKDQDGNILKTYEYHYKTDNL